jgi:hypothetical protein
MSHEEHYLVLGDILVMQVEVKSYMLPSETYSHC